MKTSEIRSRFLEFFRERDHAIVKSSALVPHDDPSLLFTNAGMVQFKRCFLGEDKRAYTRATTSQKCMRAGGKHNDLENVGPTARHHTFFEMLGNFSFGDYFKKEAVEYGWDFLVNVMGLPPDKLFATVHEGDEAMGLGPDQEAIDLWAEYLPRERILLFPTKDNFWAMGDTGPCGPCSEIMIDQGPEMGCDRPDCAPGCDCDRYLELWNLVFMQFNRYEDGTMEPLPKPSIDTGMGLERISAVMQGVRSNYDIDLFEPIMNKITEVSGHRYGDDPTHTVSMKVIADHGRAAAFLIGDGILPSNEGRGYVLRRVIRRALRHGRYLGVMRPFLNEVAVAVMEAMHDAYPELKDDRKFITSVILNEEKRFNETLDHGLGLLNSEIKRLQDEGKKTVSGDLIFKLYDTYGFPIDIITDMARDLEFDVDETGFQRLMEEQRERSRQSWKGSGEREVSEAYRSLAAEGVAPRFLGYESLEADSPVAALVKDDERVGEVNEGMHAELVAEQTPFYGAAGGQVGDVGEIVGPRGRMVVEDTFKLPGDIITHVGRVEEGSIRLGERVTLKVDPRLRRDTALNHTATHILHAILREVLGDHVKQAGSLVAPDRLRFDFTHFTHISSEDMERIERRVNEEIRRNYTLHTHVMDYDEAIKTGAMALFEEKYGDTVRLVEIPGFSRELCGGTHTHSTGDIGLFVLLHETSVAAGVRRIEALTGRRAVDYVQERDRLLEQSAAKLKTSPQELPERVERLLEHQRQMEKELEGLKTSLASKRSADLLDRAEQIAGVTALVTQVEADNPKVLREMNDRFKERLQEKGVVVLGASKDDKVFLLAGVSPDLKDRLHAGNLIKEIAGVVGGSGGGRPDMAQAGGNDPSRLPEALARAREIIAGKLGE